MSGRSGSQVRVVVTGMGAVTAYGGGVDRLWQGVMSGRTGIGLVKGIDTSACKTKVGAEVPGDVVASELAGTRLGVGDRAVDMALAVSRQALDSAGLLPAGEPPLRREMAVIFGTGVGATQSLFEGNQAFFAKGIRGLRPTTVPRCMANAISAQVSMAFGLTGPNYMIVSACTSSTTAIGTAWHMIRRGDVEQALCGGSDAVVNDPFVFGAWNNLGVMSKQTDPSRACRPFDAARDGCVVGDGAGALVLETMASAEARGASVLAEIVGYGESSDAAHITSPSAEGQSQAILKALASAGLEPKDIDFINAHGTATRANDECECRSIGLVFGAETDRIPVASNKAFFGHLLGASGVVETIVCIMGLRDGKVPANISLENQDPACRVKLVGTTATDLTMRAVMKNSFGFGGNNAVLVLTKA